MLLENAVWLGDNSGHDVLAGTRPQQARGAATVSSMKMNPRGDRTQPGELSLTRRLPHLDIGIHSPNEVEPNAHTMPFRAMTDRCIPVVWAVFARRIPAQDALQVHKKDRQSEK